MSNITRKIPNRSSASLGKSRLINNSSNNINNNNVNVENIINNNNNGETNNNSIENENIVLSSLNDCYKYINQGCEFNQDTVTSSSFKLTPNSFLDTSIRMNQYLYKTTNKEFLSKIPKFYTNEYESFNIEDKDDEIVDNIEQQQLSSTSAALNKKRTRSLNELDISTNSNGHPTSTPSSLDMNKKLKATTEDKINKSPVKRNTIVLPSPPPSQPITTSSLKKPSALKSSSTSSPALSSTTSLLDTTTSPNNSLFNKPKTTTSASTSSSSALSVLDSITKLTNSIIQQTPTPTPIPTPTSTPSLSPQLASVPNLNMFSHINLEIEKQMIQLYNRKLLEIKKLPRFYKKVDLLDISTLIPQNSDPVLAHKETVLKIGRVLYFDKVPINSEIPITRPYFNSNATTYWDKKSLPSLLDDPNIKHIVEKRDIDIVMSSSSFIKFINNHQLNNFNEEWEIPVHCKEFNIDSTTTTTTTTTKKIVSIIDKPILKRRITNREKNEKFFNIAIESFGLTMGQQSTTHPALDFNKKKLENPSATTTTPIEPPVLDEELNNKLKKTNLIYNIWEFDGMKILIRCKVHAQIAEATLTSPTNVRFVGLKTKIEYRAEKGIEEPTLSDSSKWWAYTFIRPSAHLLLSRINIWNNRLLAIEKKDMSLILSSNNPKTTFKPLKSSKITLEILKKVKSFSTCINIENSSNSSSVIHSNYILSHCPSNNFVYIYKSINQEEDEDDDSNNKEAAATSTVNEKETTVYDLHSKHSNLPTVIPESFAPPLIALPPPPKPMQPPQQSAPSFCFSFADTGSCSKGIKCGFAHLTKVQIKDAGGSYNNKTNNNNSNNNNKKKRRKKGGNNSNNSNGSINLPTNNNSNGDSISDLSYINSII